jgi:hypothetical protein
MTTVRAKPPVRGGTIRALAPADRPRLADLLTRARELLEPEIGLMGDSGIPIRDELELELPATEWPALVERDGWPST